MAASSKDAIALLKADHRTVEDCREVREARRATGERKRSPSRSASSFSPAMIEEEIFYPACEGRVEEDLMKEAYVEHDGAKVLIAEMKRGAPETTILRRQGEGASEEIEHHVKEEEKPDGGASLPRRARPGSTWMRWANSSRRARKSWSPRAIPRTAFPSPR